MKYLVKYGSWNYLIADRPTDLQTDTYHSTPLCCCSGVKIVIGTVVICSVEVLSVLKPNIHLYLWGLSYVMPCASPWHICRFLACTFTSELLGCSHFKVWRTRTTLTYLWWHSFDLVLTTKAIWVTLVCMTIKLDNCWRRSVWPRVGIWSVLCTHTRAVNWSVHN